MTLLMGKVTQPLLEDQEQPVGTGSFSQETNSKSPTEDAGKVPGSSKDSSEVWCSSLGHTCVGVESEVQGGSPVLGTGDSREVWIGESFSITSIH